jgi:FKBP-type peptidyl-prolyl cis-trans isomerase
MFKKTLLYISLCILTVWAMSCNKGRQKTNFGLEYEHHVSNGGKTPQNGDKIKLHYKLFAKVLGKDSILRNTYYGEPLDLSYDTASLDPIIKGMRMVSEGDSISFYINVDSLFRGQRPMYVDAGSEARLTAKIISVVSNDEFIKIQQKRMEEMQKDEAFKYEHIIKNDGVKPKNGDIITMHIMIFGKSRGRDTLVQNTYQQNMPYPMEYNSASPDSITKSMGMVSPNDSIRFDISADVLFRGQRPPFIDMKSRVILTAKVLKIQSRAEYDEIARKESEEQQKELEKKRLAQKGVDDQIIKKYVSDNKLKANKTASGLYYVITAPGSGEKPQTNQQVAVHYKGTLLNGQLFDSSEGKEPLGFAYNTGQMIKGFDEGVGFLGKGGKAILLIPSHLAYGEQGAGGGQIPPFSVLRFDIELVEIKPISQ